MKRKISIVFEELDTYTDDERDMNVYLEGDTERLQSMPASAFSPAETWAAQLFSAVMEAIAEMEGFEELDTDKEGMQ